MESNSTLMRAKFRGRCATCEKEIAVGANIYYYFDTKKAQHEHCRTQLVMSVDEERKQFVEEPTAEGEYFHW